MGPQFPFSFILKEQVSEIAQASNGGQFYLKKEKIAISENRIAVLKPVGPHFPFSFI